MSDLYKVENYDLSDCLQIKEYTNKDEGTSCIKRFPVFNGREIFKPISKQKPLVSDLFALSEVFCSNIAGLLKVNHAGYRLAKCNGAFKLSEKYLDKGVVSESFLSLGEEFVSLLDFYRQHKNFGIDLKRYINFALCVYDFEKFYEALPFAENPLFSYSLAKTLLFKTLIADTNAHFGNIGFIKNVNGSIRPAPVFDNEYSNLFLNFKNPVRHKNLSKSMNENTITAQRLVSIRRRFPQLYFDFQRQLKTLKESDVLRETCDFTGLGDYITYYEPGVYNEGSSEELKQPASSKDLEELSDFVYDSFNSQIDFILES